MGNLTEILKKNSIYALLFIPVFYFMIGVYFRYIFGDLSLRSVDPDYMHFLSGLCVSTGRFSQANIDHPASTLQLILAIVFRIIYLFRSHSVPFFEDAIINSDLYLAIANLILTTIISIAILIAGYKIYKLTDNLIIALLIQTSPFIANVWYDIIGRIYPEILLPIPVFILIILFFQAIYNEEKEPSVGWFAFAIAFGLATKATFLPVAILPFFILKTKKQLIRYLILTLVFYLFLALPVTFQINRYWLWMKGLFMHSGNYGQGQANIINPEVFINNIKEIFNSEKVFFYSIGLLATVTALFSRSANTTKEKTIFRISLGVIILLLLQTFLISKQYAFRYFVPVLLFSPFILFLIRECINLRFPNKKVYLGTSALLIFFLVRTIVIQIPSIQLRSQYIGEQMQARIESSNVVKMLPKESYKIIVTQDYGCPFHEYAIMHSFCVAGQRWPGYREKLAAIYPNIYQFFTWDNTIKYWGKEFNPDEITESNKPVFLYLEKNTEELYNKTILKLLEKNKGYSVDKKLLFENPANGEGILQLFFSKQ